MTLLLAAWVCVAAAPPAEAPVAEKPRLAVLELTAGVGVDPALVAPLTDAVTIEVQSRGFFDVTSSRDIATLLGVERQKQLLGCSDSSCFTELAGALGARFVLSGSVSRIGNSWQLTLTTLDTVKAQPLARAVRLDNTLEGLRAQLAWVVAEATGTPLPPPPSRVVPVTLLVVAGVATAFGLAWGGVHLAQEQQLAGRLNAGAKTPGVLGSMAEARLEADRIAVHKWVALGAIAAGVGLGLTGFLLMPSERVRVTLVPMGSGLGVAGSF